jgi:hypothetical protein
VLFDHPPYSPISRRATTASLLLPIWRTGWDHRVSTLMRSCWKMSEGGWSQRRQTSLTIVYTNLFLNTRSVQVIIMLLWIITPPLY